MAISFIVCALFGFGFGGWVPLLVFAQMYNKAHIEFLITDGYWIDGVISKFTLEQLQGKLKLNLVSRIGAGYAATRR